MFSNARRAAKDEISKAKKKENPILTLPSRCLPKSYTVKQLYDELAAGDETRTKEAGFENLLIVRGCLGVTSGIIGEDGDDEYFNRLCLWIAEVITPDENLVPNDEAPEDISPAKLESAIRLACQQGIVGLQSLSLLQALSPLPQNAEMLLSLLAFTSPRDPWTTPASLETAKLILSNPHLQSALQSPSFIPTTILTNFIRPLFSKSRSSAITATGRKAMPSSLPPKKQDIQDQERASKPWKYETVYSVTVFEWAVDNISTEAVNTAWPLIVPPILALLDVSTTSLRVRGLELTSTFLRKFPSKILTQSGLSSVFEDAITPTLHFLPTITPLPESLLLQPAAYSALLTLCSTLYPSDEPTPPSSPNLSPKEVEILEQSPLQIEKFRYLDRIMRGGIFSAYSHCPEQPAIVQVLVMQLGRVVEVMGIQCVKHLKDIIPMLCSVLMDPFGPARPESLMEAAKVLGVVIRNAWPRVREERWRREVIRALLVCWKQVSAEGGGGIPDKLVGFDEVKGEIKVVGRLLVRVMDRGLDFKEELRPLATVNREVVEEVFGLDYSDTEE